MSKPLYEILERPLITEKSVTQSQAGRYTFRCKTSANKVEIRAALEQAYGVKVQKINTLVVKGKSKRAGRAKQGKVADWKKAVVSLTADSNPAKLKEVFEGA